MAEKTVNRNSIKTTVSLLFPFSASLCIGVEARALELIRAMEENEWKHVRSRANRKMKAWIMVAIFFEILSILFTSAALSPSLLWVWWHEHLFKNSTMNGCHSFSNPSILFISGVDNALYIYIYKIATPDRPPLAAVMLLCRSPRNNQAGELPPDTFWASPHILSVRGRVG